jgi:hypothetical protein
MVHQAERIEIDQHTKRPRFFDDHQDRAGDERGRIRSNGRRLPRRNLRG